MDIKDISGKAQKEMNMFWKLKGRQSLLSNSRKRGGIMLYCYAKNRTYK